MIPTYEIIWKDPYKGVKECDEKNFLYLITGTKQGTNKKKVRYVGKASNTANQRYKDPANYYNKNAPRYREVWIGKIRKSQSAKKRNAAISKAEWLNTIFLDKLNDTERVSLLNNKLRSEPKNSFGIINRWYKHSSNCTEYARQRFPINIIPDLIFWDSKREQAYSAEKVFTHYDD